MIWYLQIIDPTVLVWELALARVWVTVVSEDAGLNVPMDFVVGTSLVRVSVAPAVDSSGIFGSALRQRDPLRFQGLDLSQLVAGLPQL